MPSPAEIDARDRQIAEWDAEDKREEQARQARRHGRGR